MAREQMASNAKDWPTHWRRCGDVDIDAARLDVAATPTDAANLWDRVDTLWSWMVMLQRLGVDLGPFLPVLDRIEVDDIERAPADALRAVDEAFGVLAELQERADAEGDVTAPYAAPPAPNETSRSTAWPVYGGDPQHTAGTDAPGPTHGQIAWRFATGLAWYVKPAVEGRRVYATSPGIRNMMWCLDLDDGRVIWKTRRHRRGRVTAHSHTMPQSYTTPGAASTPQLLDDGIVVAELGAQNLEEGTSRLRWIDKATGRLINTVPVGHADYRMGYARLAGNGAHLVHTDGIQRITPSPPQAVGHNRALCRRADDGRLMWDFPIGLTFADPVLDEHRAYIGTHDGAFFALNLQGESEGEHFGYSDMGRVAWQYTAGAAINGAAVVTEEVVVFGANDGVVYCVDRTSGELRWRSEASPIEPRAFQLFSKPAGADDQVFVGSACGLLICLDLRTGDARWTHDCSGWIRAQPVVHDGRVTVATLDGRLLCLGIEGDSPQRLWEASIGDFGVLADMVFADGALLVSDCRLMLHCVDAVTGAVRWRHRLLQHADFGGRAVQTDELACGGFHQSKPTAAGGMLFVGSPARFVFGIDGRTGKERWRFEMGGAISGAPAFESSPDGGRIFVGQQGGENDFYCLDAKTGMPLWKQGLGWVWSSANVADGRVFVPAVDGYLNCLDAASGHILWRYRTGRAAHPEAPVDAGRVFFGSWDHFVYAFDAETGRLLWKFHTGGSPDSGAPIAYDGRLYVPMGGKRLCCLDAATGAIHWEVRPDRGCMNASPALWNERLFISMSVRSGAIPPYAEIRCLDTADGSFVWRHPGGGITAPCVAGGRVCFASTTDCFFRCVDATGDSDGHTECYFRVAMGDRVYESVPAIHDGQACILSEDGYLYSFR